VALSGEGADELFGGYEAALEAAAAFEADPADPRDGGAFQLEAMAWVAPSLKSQVLSRDAWEVAAGDEFLHAHYAASFERARRECGPHAGAVDAHLRFQRRENLTSLVQRLDSATMLASVEGRTPFADREVARLAERLPMSAKYPAHGGAGGAVATAVRGKRVLREAFGHRLPRGVVERSKHSFPLPFQEWIEDLGWRLETSPFASICFDAGVRQEVVRDPGRLWQLAWPMMNLALWGDRWWGYPA
jgi:asparagine synthase (glutamine-hydrolysing)